jgi:hypothetical protein
MSNDEQPGSLDGTSSSGQRRPDDAPRMEPSADPIASVMQQLGLSQTVAAPPRSVTLLAKNLHHPEWSVRAAAAQRLGTLPQHKALSALLSRALEDENEYVRAAAARSLGRQGTEAAIPGLLRALHDQAWMVRAGAVLALGHLAENVPAEPLVLALKDTDASVRATAAWALGKLGTRAPLEKLLTTLEDPEWSVREATMLALGELHTRVPASALKAAQADTDRSVREAADQALQQAVATPIALSKGSIPSLQGLTQRGLGKFRNHMRRWGVPSDEQADETIVIIGPDEPSTPDHPSHDLNRSGSIRRRPARTSRLLHIAESGVAVLVLVAVVFFWLAFPGWSPLHPSGAPRSTPLLIHNRNAGADYQITWAPDSTRLAISSDDGSVGVWDTTTGQLITTYQNTLSRSFSLSWTPDDSLLVASQATDRVVRVWSTLNKRVLLMTPPLPGNVAAAAWSPNGDFIAFDSGDNTIQVWNISTGEQVSTYTGHKNRILALTWSPDSKYLASISYDQTMQVWVAATGTQAVSSLITGLALTSVNWSPLQHTTSGENSGFLALATFSGSVEIWDTTSWLKTFTISPIGQTKATPSPLFVTSLAWSPDGTVLALATADGSIQLYNPVTGDLIDSYQNQSEDIEDLAWSPDSAHLASASPGGTVQVERVRENAKPGLVKIRTSVPTISPSVTLFPSSVL